MAGGWKALETLHNTADDKYAAWKNSPQGQLYERAKIECVKDGSVTWDIFESNPVYVMIR